MMVLNRIDELRMGCDKMIDETKVEVEVSLVMCKRYDVDHEREMWGSGEACIVEADQRIA